MPDSPTYHAETLLQAACERHRIDLALLVAETAFWADPEVHRRLVQADPSGAFFPGTRRARVGSGEVRGSVVDGIRLDDNSAANQAIKKALGLAPSQVLGFETCHLWPGTAYDARYHTVIANLVLLPRALASLSDHDSRILAILQYRAFELYDWHPAEVPQPVRPKGYPTRWRAPEPFTPEIGLTLARRAVKGDRGEEEVKTAVVPAARREVARAGSADQTSPGDALMSATERNFVVGRIRRWAERPGQKVHKIIALVLRTGASLPRQQLAEAIETHAGSTNGYGAIANLLRSDGNAYGRVFVDRNGRIEIHPAIEDEIRRHQWR